MRSISPVIYFRNIKVIVAGEAEKREGNSQLKAVVFIPHDLQTAATVQDEITWN